MNAEVEKFESGWLGIRVSMQVDEVDQLINQLTRLRAGQIGHFHCAGTYEANKPGVGDIEFSLIGDLPHNMKVS